MRLILLPISLLTICVQADGVQGPLSLDFQKWLAGAGYGADDFVRSKDYGTQGSFGGFTDTNNATTKTPVIFCHGNTDTALKTNSFSTGWDNTISYFISQGYTKGDLYATSWGDNKKVHASGRTHNCYEVTRLRRFVEAVLAYTQALKVSIVSHSMGVTLMRKVIKGGAIQANDGNCNLGPGIGSKVDVFVGLAGANYGMCNCEGGAVIEEASCNKKNGFWPGDYCGMNNLICGAHPLPMPCDYNKLTYSSFLTDLNNDHSKEGDLVYSAWSTGDDIIYYQDMAWSRPTSLIPTSDNRKIYSGLTHMQTKENTAPDQYSMVALKKCPN